MDYTGKKMGLPFFQKELFHKFNSRIYEGKKWQVYLNKSKDFGCIYPKPKTDYSSFVPRSKRLGLKESKTQKKYLNARLKLFSSLLDENNLIPDSILEIGSSSGDCLRLISKTFPKAQCFGIEPSAKLRLSAEEKNLNIYENIKKCGKKSFDVICMFHVFEHFENPIATLKEMESLLSSRGIFIIEIPSLTDPLLSLYDLPAYKDFYFQAQHPYIYSPSSLKKLLEKNGYDIVKILPFQRYGLANHLNWLKNNKPGIIPLINDNFNSADLKYKEKLENLKITDTLFACFKPAE